MKNDSEHKNRVNYENACYRLLAKCEFNFFIENYKYVIKKKEVVFLFLRQIFTEWTNKQQVYTIYD